MTTASSSPVDCRSVEKRQCSTSSVAVERADVGLRVADVDRQEHGEIIPERPPRGVSSPNARPAGPAAALQRRAQVRPRRRVDLQQRHEHEPAARDLRMGQAQALRREDLVLHQQDVDVDRPRTVPRAPGAAHLTLYLLARVEQLQRAEPGLDAHDGVQEVALVRHLAHRLRLVDGRAGIDPHAQRAPRAAPRRLAGWPGGRRRWSPGRARPGLAPPAADLHRDLVDRQGDRRLRLGGADHDPARPEALLEHVRDGGTYPLERAIGPLGGDQCDGLAHRGVVDRVLEAVGHGRVAVLDVEGDVEHHALACLLLGLGDPVMGEEREARDLDRHVGVR